MPVCRAPLLLACCSHPEGGAHVDRITAVRQATAREESTAASARKLQAELAAVKRAKAEAAAASAAESAALQRQAREAAA